MESKGPPLRIENLEAYLDEGLEHESQVVELLVVAQARGQGSPELWDKLHSAAMRDDRLMELATVYERLATDRRVKIMPPAQQAQVFLFTARFFKRALGDIDAAERALERVLTLAPGQPEAFGELQKILEEKGERSKLVALHLAAVGPKTEREVALPHLQAALKIAREIGEVAEVSKVASQLLKLDPASELALVAVVESLEDAAKFPELARALEQLLAADPPVPEERRAAARARLIELYDDKLPDIEKAMPHVEEVLAVEPQHPGARRVATRLLGIKAVAARAAQALAAVYESEGDHAALTQMLGIQIEQLRGPKKAEAQKKLGALHWDVGDDASAFTQYEAVMAVDQSDDEVRTRFVELARRLGKQADASRMLTRAAAAVKDPAVRARINLETARLMAEAGDPKRARVVLQTVLDQAEPEVALEAARVMRGITPEVKGQVQVLEAIAKLSPDPDEKLEVLEQLAALYEGELKDLNSAIHARTRILTVDPTRDSVELERLLEARGDFARLVEVLEAKAGGLSIDEERRELLLRAATIALEQMHDHDRARRLLEGVARDHGPARDVHALLLPLYADDAFGEERINVLTAELELADDAERATLSAELGASLLRAGRVDQALGAFAEVLGFDREEPTARRELLALVESGEREHKLSAAAVLAPLLREEGHADLPLVLRAIATEAPEFRDRLEALDELYHLLPPTDGVARLKLAAKGLSDAVANAPESVLAWSSRVEAQVDDVPPLAVAMALAAPLEGVTLAEGPLLDLCLLAAGHLATVGKPDRAIALYRRALELRPDDDAIVAEIAELLKKVGTPNDRVALFRGALERPSSDERRRELLLSIASIQLDELSDARAAIATLREGLAALPGDVTIKSALLDALEASESFGELADELEKSRTEVETPRQAAELDLRVAGTLVRANDLEAAARHFRSALAEPTFPVDVVKLEPILELARARVDVPLLIAVCERRVALADDPRTRLEWLLELAGLFGDKGGDPARAAERYAEAGALAEAEGFPEARSAWERVLAFRPDDKDALGRLVTIHRANGEDAALEQSVARLVAISADRPEAVAALESLRGSGVAPDRVLGLLEQIDERFGASVDGQLIRADILVQTGREAEAVDLLLALAIDPEVGPRALGLLDEIFAVATVEPSLYASKRRWLAHRIAAADPVEKRQLSFELFRFERDVTKDVAEAEQVLESLLSSDPHDEDALVARFDLANARGDRESAVSALRARVDAAVDGDRVRRSLELADYLARDESGVLDALDVVEPLAGSTESPDDAALLRRVATLALAHESVGKRAAQVLVRVADAMETREERAAVFEHLFENAPRGALADDEEQLWEAWLGCLDAKSDQALDVAARAAGALPGLESFWDRAEELARAQKRPQPVADAYKASLDRPLASSAGPAGLDEEGALRVGERGVAFVEEWFDDQEVVVGMLRRIVALAPSATWAFDRLKLIYNAAERWTELFGLYDDVVKGQTDDDARVMILEDAVEVARDLVGDAERAISYLEQLRTFRRSDAKLALSLEKLYERHNKSEALVALLLDRLEQLGPDEVADTRVRIASLQEVQLGDRLAALDTLDPLLEAADPRAMAVLGRWLEERAPSSLTHERYQRLARGGAGNAPALQRAAERLAPAFRASGDGRGLAGALSARLEFDLAPSERLEALKELQSVAATLGDTGLTLDAGLAQLILTPDEAGAELVVDTVLVDVVADRERVTALANALLTIANSERSRERALFLLKLGARIARAELKDESLGITFELAVLARSDGDPAAALAAAKKLDQDLLAMGREAERCAVLEQLGALATARDDKRASLIEAARIAHEVIGDRGRALVSLRAWLAVDPKDLEVLSRVVDHLRVLGDAAGLCEALDARAPLQATAADKSKDLVELGTVLSRIVKDRPRAIEAYRAAHELTPDPRLCDELRKLLRDEERWDDLVAADEAEVARDASPERRATLLCEVGDVERLRDDSAAALDAYTRALREDAAHEGAQSGLGALVESLAPTERVFAAGVSALAKSFEAAGQLDRWLALVPSRLSCMTNELEKCEMLLAAARLEESVQHDAERALERTITAFDIRPEFPGVAEALLDRAKRTGSWDLVAPHLLPALSTRQDVPRSVATELLVLAAEHLARAGAEYESVEALLAAAHATAPTDAEVLDRLVGHRRARPDASLVRALEALAELRPEDLGLLEEASTVAMRDQGDEEGAFRLAVALRAAAAERLAAGADPEVEDKLAWALDVEAAGLDRRGRGVEQVAVLVAVAELPVSAPRRRELLRRAAASSEPAARASILEKVYADDPTDTETFEELAALYESLGKNLELARLSARMADETVAPGDRARLRLRAAELQVGLGAKDTATSLLRSTLTELPTHEPSVRLLAELLTEKGAHGELATLLEAEGDVFAQSDKALALSLFDRAATLAEGKLRDAPRAVRSVQKMVAIDPSAGLLDRLATLHQKVGRYEDEASTLERLVEVAGPSDELSLRLATSYGKAGFVERARDQLESALAEGRGSARVREVLAEIYRATGSHGPLAELYETEAEESDDVAVKVEKLRSAAAIHLKELGDAEKATQLLERAIAHKPDDLSTLFTLAEVHRTAGDADRGKQVLTKILSEFGTRKPKERALVHFELAKLALQSNDRTTALTELEAASKIDPAHAGVLSLLGEVSILEGQFLRANRTYRGLLLVLRSHKGDKPKEHLESKARVLVELAFVADSQKEPERRAEFLESAFTAAREDASEFEHLMAALDKRGYSAEYARALDECLAGGDVEAGRRITLRIEQALLMGRKLGKPEEATTVALECLAELVKEPRDLTVHVSGVEQPAVPALLGLLVDLGKLPQVYAHFLAAARDSLGEERVENVKRALAIAESDMEDPEKTAEALEELLLAWDDSGGGTGAERRATLEKLDKLLAPHNASEAGALRHVRVLARLADLLAAEGEPFEVFGSVLYRVLAIHVRNGDLDESVAVLDRVRSEDPGPDRFERELRAVIAAAPGEVRLVRMLEDFGRDRGRTQATIDALLMSLDGSSDPTAVLKEAYELSTELEDSAQSERLLRRLVKPSPDDDTTEDAWSLSALADLRFGASDAKEAASLWERAARVSDPNEERTLLLRVADLVDRVLGETSRAVSIFEGLRKRDPADRELWQPLADLHRRAGDSAAFTALMEETIPLVDDSKERNSLRVGLAELVEPNDAERAADILAEVIDEEPGNVDAAVRLEKLYTVLGRDDQLVILVERQLDAAKDVDSKERVVGLSLRIGSIRERLGDLDAALDAYHGALDWDENNLEALRSAVRLHTEREDSLVLGDLLDRLLLLEQGEDAVKLALRVADTKLASGDAVGAERALVAGFKANGRSAELKQRLTTLYNERGDKLGLARLSAGEARYIDDAKVKKELLFTAAETIKAEGEVREASDVYADAFALDPDDRDTLFAFMDACANTGQHQRAIDAVDRALVAEGRDAWLLFSRAVLREAVGESDAALDDLEAAYEASNGQYAAELRAHLEAALARVQLDPGASRRTESTLRVRLADVLATTGDPAGARALLEAELARDPQNPELLATVGRIEESSGREEAAAMAYARACAVASGELLTRTALRLYECSIRLDRPALSRAGLERALGADPRDADVRAALRSVYEASGAIAELADLIVAEAHTQDDPEQRFERLLEAARLLLYSTGEDGSITQAAAERAARVLEEAKLVRADSQDMLQLSAEALSALGRIDEAREIVGGVIASHKSKRSKELGQAFYALYRIEAKGGNLSEAIEALAKAFDNQPQNGSLALELGQLAIDLDEHEIAQRAFRAVTLLKPDGSISTRDRAIAYYHLGSIAARAGDARRAKLMLEKSLAEDATLDAARDLLATL
jgi:predicted Zn-dependent protease